MELETELNKLAQNIKALEHQRSSLGEALKKIKAQIEFPKRDSDIIEDKFVTKVKPDELKNLKVAAVDGGIVQTKLHGVNLVVGRAAAVVFDFKNGVLFNTNYYPDAFPSHQLLSFNAPITDRDYAISISLNRQIMEISTAEKVVSNFSPELMLLDGSVLPLAMDKPEKNSPEFKRYENLIQTYLSLYRTCSKKKTQLAGVIEDSGGLRLTTLLKEKVVPGVIQSSEFDGGIVDVLEQNKSILENTNDSNVIFYILDVGERTCVYSYSADPEKHQVLKDLEDYGGKIFSFYLKTVPFDRPIRIDFVSESDMQEKITKIANDIASKVLAMSMHNETYGFPSILIEADGRARLSERDLDLIYHRLKDKVGDLPSLFKLRRELRPF
ncbi:TPA: DNA double-strand break repair nuclease NurA [archaeon]|uniref:DNA double-strand break repair nuclease NurA n=1 Tax=Candidatus Naiadarchaeum limnaeum TaxID=2756139 RepID=A0A832XJP7_9ARCH|nr:DNA double-strand break repair nuclease NurA [Candidatus Naiadarchaeum limnaeum]